MAAKALRARLPSSINAGSGCIIFWLANVFRSDDDAVDLDGAVEAMEHMGHYLQSVSLSDATRIQDQLDRVAEYLRKKKQSDDAVEFVSEFLRNAGLDV